MKNHTILGWLFIVCVSVVMLGFVTVFVPYNDDEFIHFHIVRCFFFPASDVGDGLCNDRTMNLFATSINLPLRVYAYIGSITVLLYMPLYTLLGLPIAVRITGLLSLLVS